jgi:hypothetical protein
LESTHGVGFFFLDSCLLLQLELRKQYLASLRRYLPVRSQSSSTIAMCFVNPPSRGIRDLDSQGSSILLFDFRAYLCSVLLRYLITSILQYFDTSILRYFVLSRRRSSFASLHDYFRTMLENGILLQVFSGPNRRLNLSKLKLVPKVVLVLK